MTFSSVLEKLTRRLPLTGEDFVFLLTGLNREEEERLYSAARQTARERFGNRIFIRGLIEISNICKNDCYYCGIRKSNGKVVRYRLTQEQILSCCEIGYSLGFRTFVLQGGEDGAFTDHWLCELLGKIKGEFPDCAITLSLGERSRESYRRLKQAGTDRYLLREETADFAHYRRLHPESMSPERRQDCLFALKELGYQTGGGFMVGSPGQTPEHLAKDFLFLQKLQPQMVGIGPFLPHQDTPFRDCAPGAAEQTVRCVAILRLLLPGANLPATTALATLDPHGRQKAVLAGANVIMPNLSPAEVRDNYSLYDHKAHSGAEAAEGLRLLQQQMEEIGYTLCVDRGDSR